MSNLNVTGRAGMGSSEPEDAETGQGGAGPSGGKREDGADVSARHGGAMTDELGNATGTGGIGHMDGHSLGAGAAGPTRTGDTGTGTPGPNSAEGSGTTGAIPETTHEGSSPGAGNTGIAP